MKSRHLAPIITNLTLFGGKYEPSSEEHKAPWIKETDSFLIKWAVE